MERKSGMPKDRQGILDDIFPELKESEDERIRKELLSVYKDTAERIGDDREWRNGITFREILAWLEKQGESDETKAKMFLVNKGYPIDANGIFPTYEEMYNIIREGLEKQGEQDYINPDSLIQQRIDALADITAEQMPANKVEPKFKIEEEKYYVCTQTYVLRGKIVVIKGQIYKSNKNDAIEGEGGLFIDKIDGKTSDYFRLWTIQDAKDGDVLANDYYIVIFKRLWKYKTAFDWCCGIKLADNMWHFDGSGEEDFDPKGFHPASKEQRDTLMKAMADAGYTFDFEKKELKKIETKSENYKKQVMDEMADLVKDYIKQPKNLAWSEEDEHRLKDAIYFLETTKNHYASTVELDSCIDWLKSFKQRMGE